MRNATLMTLGSGAQPQLLQPADNKGKQMMLYGIVLNVFSTERYFQLAMGLLGHKLRRITQFVLSGSAGAEQIFPPNPDSPPKLPTTTHYA